MSCLASSGIVSFSFCISSAVYPWMENLVVTSLCITASGKHERPQYTMATGIGGLEKSHEEERLDMQIREEDSWRYGSAHIDLFCL